MKIIGRVMNAEEAETEEKKGNHVIAQGDGYRRIVAAPKPLDIVEIDAIRTLSDAGQVVIACGGGGIPVLPQDHCLKGASAVIEKDTIAGRLADLVDADMLVILTGVDKVCLNFGQADEKPLDYMTVRRPDCIWSRGSLRRAPCCRRFRRRWSTSAIPLSARC